MDNLLEYIEERKFKNKLLFDAVECFDYITTKYTSSEANTHKRFFYYVRENVYNSFLNIENNLFELKIRGKSVTPFFEFEHDIEYRKWLQFRKDFYSSKNTIGTFRMLNFLELSLMNFITDLTSLQEYELIAPDGSSTKFKKIGYGTDQDQQSFIKYLGRKFKQGFTFKAL